MQDYKGGIACQRPQLAGNLQIFKILEAAPGTSQDPSVVIVILKGYGYPEHGDITEYHHIKQSRKQHTQQRAVLSYLPPKSFSFHLHTSSPGL